jgi:Mrp family chromosome partitioning ATPase
MARMLETLRKGDDRRPLAAPGVVAKLHGSDCVMEWSVSDAHIPFIEVGGPGKLVEGSAEVMAVPHPAQAKQPPHPPVVEALSKSTIRAQLTETKPLTVAYQPWTGPVAGSSGIAASIIAFHQPAHAISKQYAELWHTMTAPLSKTGGQALLIAGLRPQVGATTVVLNLAMAGALQAKQRVVLVDAQTCEPSLAERLGYTAETGLLDIVAGQAALEPTVVQTVVPSLHLLPLVRRDHVTLTPEATAWLLGRLRERFEVVLMDGPSLHDIAALAALAPCCDALFLVAPQGETQALPRDLLQAISRFSGKLRGVLHTHVEV